MTYIQLPLDIENLIKSFIQEKFYQCWEFDYEDNMIHYYELPVPWYTLQVFYDFKARRYLVNGLDNALAPLRFSDKINPNEFSPLALDYYVR